MEEKIKSASEWQGGDRYPGIDMYEKVELKPGHELCSLVLIDEKGRVRPCEFLFPTRALRMVGDDAAELNRMLQLAPTRMNNDSKICTYKAVLASFRLRENVVFEKCISTENTAYGKGGLPRYYLPLDRFQELIEHGGLKRAKFENESISKILNHYEVKPREYVGIISRVRQLQYRRNLFCAQKAKLDTLDIIQNSPRGEDVDKAQKNLKKLDENILSFKERIKDSVRRHGSVPSPLYDELNRRLDSEIKIRESEDNVLVLGNVHTELSTTNASGLLGHANLNVLSFSELDKLESVPQNLFRKIDDFSKRNPHNEIDVKEQSLVEVMNINRINKDCLNVMVMEGLKPRSFQSLERIALSSSSGERMLYRLEDVFTDDSIQKIRSTQNGKLTEPLEMKDGRKAKLMMMGNKANLYIAQPKESLNNVLDQMSLGDTERKRLLNGETIAYKQSHVKLDKDLNCVIAGTLGRLSDSSRSQKQPRQLSIPKGRERVKKRGISL